MDTPLAFTPEAIAFLTLAQVVSPGTDTITTGALVSAIIALFGYLMIELRASRTRAEEREDRSTKIASDSLAGMNTLADALNAVGGKVGELMNKLSDLATEIRLLREHHEQTAAAARRNGERLEALERRVTDLLERR